MDRPITAIVTNTDSAAMPKKAFGKLNPANLMNSACHDSATVEQETTAFTSQPSLTPGLRASCSGSADSMRETNNAAAEAANMTRYVQTAP